MACLLVEGRMYFCAKLDQASTVWTKPEPHEYDDRLCYHFLWQAKKYASSLCESCACKANGVFEIDLDAIEQ
jgi:hypothetical protein